MGFFHSLRRGVTSRSNSFMTTLKLLDESGVDVHTEADLTKAAIKIVELTK